MQNGIKSGMPVITAAPVTGADKAAAARAEKEKQLRKACADFEAIFAYHLFKSMRDTVPASGLTDRFPGKETYTMLMDQKIAEELSKSSNGLGVKEMLYRQLAGKLLKNERAVNTVTPEKAVPDILVSKD
ncbi:MAG: rod-binding protein [Syntrophaceae bacterium]|nr:rod-binding protein [Syntrophaceae bacterium]